MRKTLTAAVAAAATLAGIITAAPANAALPYDPRAAVKVVPGTDVQGRTGVAVVLKNKGTEKVSPELVVKNPKTGKWSSQYVPVAPGRVVVKRFWLTEGQTRRYSVTYAESTLAARKVTGRAPTTTYARVNGRQCAGVGTNVEFLYGNPTDSAKTFLTTVWMGDGSGKVTKRTTVPANTTDTAKVQIGNQTADTWTRLASGRDLGSRFVEAVC